MPVEFLTAEQAKAYGKFTEEPTRPELERFFFLDDEDRKLIAKRRGDHNRLGFALQMCTVRYIGLFSEDPLAVPWPVAEHLAAQPEIEDVSCVKEYTERLKTAYEHAWEIRDVYGYHPFEDHAQAGGSGRSCTAGRGRRTPRGHATDKKAHIFATFVSATDCRQELAVAEKGNPGRGTARSTPGFVPSAHAVRFDCNNPVACS
nr:DUF4158 domain-containing protein [Actinacidiphila oryziradicis]